MNPEECLPSSTAPSKGDNTIHSVRDTVEGQPTEEPVLRTSILLELGEDSKLGQHNVYHARVALEYIQVSKKGQWPILAWACDLGFILRRRKK